MRWIVPIGQIPKESRQLEQGIPALQIKPISLKVKTESWINPLAGITQNFTINITAMKNTAPKKTQDRILCTMIRIPGKPRLHKPMPGPFFALQIKNKAALFREMPLCFI